MVDGIIDVPANISFTSIDVIGNVVAPKRNAVQGAGTPFVRLYVLTSKSSIELLL